MLRGGEIRLIFQPHWAQAADDAGRGGLLTADEGAGALLGTVLSYPEVGHVVPDLISLGASADPRLVAATARLLEREAGLVKSVLLVGMGGSA